MKNIYSGILASITSASIALAISLSQAQNQAIPSGTIMAFGGLNVPQGWVLCDGRALDKDIPSNRQLYNAILTFHGNGTTGTGSSPRTDFNVPDYRGRFLRGVDGSASRDADSSAREAAATGGKAGNHVGSVQNDELKSHNHANYSSEHSGAIVASPRQFLSGGNINHTSISNAIQPTGGSETRPKNAYVQFIIKL